MLEERGRKRKVGISVQRDRGRKDSECHKAEAKERDFMKKRWSHMSNATEISVRMIKITARKDMSYEINMMDFNEMLRREARFEWLEK